MIQTLPERILGVAKTLIKNPVFKAQAQALINSVVMERFPTHESGKNMLQFVDLDRLLKD